MGNLAGIFVVVAVFLQLERVYFPLYGLPC